MRFERSDEGGLSHVHVRRDVVGAAQGAPAQQDEAHSESQRARADEPVHDFKTVQPACQRFKSWESLASSRPRRALPGPGQEGTTRRGRKRQSGAVPPDLARPGGFRAPRGRATVRRVVDGPAGPTTARYRGSALVDTRSQWPKTSSFSSSSPRSRAGAPSCCSPPCGGSSGAQFGREAGIKRSQRLERRVFLIGVALVVAMVTVVVTVQLSRAPGCHGTLVMVAGPDGRPLECACEQGRRGACFDPGP